MKTYWGTSLGLDVLYSVLTHCSLRIPLGKDNRPGKRHNTQHSSILFPQNLARLDIAFPDNNSIVVLVTNRNLVTIRVDH